jgi:bacteriorhodopsin
MITQNKRLAGIIFTAAILLLVPLVAMRFTSEVKWSFFDFLVAGFLLFGAGLLLELILRKVKTIRQRIILCVVLFVALALIWAELAVGIFGTPFAGS